jgi:hypothetical protein
LPRKKAKATTSPLTPQARRQVESELGHYMAALNIDAQFAVRKCVFLIRLLALPERPSLKRAMEDLEERLTLLREAHNFGRPWSAVQIRRIYWTTAKRFTRRPVHPMTPEEWRSYMPTVSRDQIVELGKRFRASRARQRARG